MSRTAVDFAYHRAMVLGLLMLKATDGRDLFEMKQDGFRRIEESLAGAFGRAGWSPEDAVEDAIRFMMQTILDHRNASLPLRT